MTDDKLMIAFVLVALAVLVGVSSSRRKLEDRRLRTLELRVQMLEED